MKRLILLLSVLGMLSCTRNENLERTFQRAGENRAELEKVLLHYLSASLIHDFFRTGSPWSFAENLFHVFGKDNLFFHQ